MAENSPNANGIHPHDQSSDATTAKPPELKYQPTILAIDRRGRNHDLESPIVGPGMQKEMLDLVSSQANVSQMVPKHRNQIRATTISDFSTAIAHSAQP
jgi:hypothetical protein